MKSKIAAQSAVLGFRLVSGSEAERDIIVIAQGTTLGRFFAQLAFKSAYQELPSVASLRDARLEINFNGNWHPAEDCVIFKLPPTF